MLDSILSDPFILVTLKCIISLLIELDLLNVGAMDCWNASLSHIKKKIGGTDNTLKKY